MRAKPLGRTCSRKRRGICRPAGSSVKVELVFKAWGFDPGKLIQSATELVGLRQHAQRDAIGVWPGLPVMNSGTTGIDDARFALAPPQADFDLDGRVKSSVRTPAIYTPTLGAGSVPSRRGRSGRRFSQRQTGKDSPWRLGPWPCAHWRGPSRGSCRG